MLEQIATVVETRGDQLWVETESRSSCSHCSSASCTTSVVAKLFGIKRNRLQLENTLGATIGQQIVIGIPDDLLIRASLWAYLLPILMMILFTLAGNLTGASDGLQSLMALMGLAIGFVLLHRVTRSASSEQRFKPQFLRLAELNPGRIEIVNFSKNTRGQNNE